MAERKRKPGRKPLEQTLVRTNLAEWRVKRGVTQKEMADAIGITLSSYWRLETGRMVNPPIEYLARCSIVLGCELDDLIEDWQLRWPSSLGDPPDPKTFWRNPE